MTLIGEGGAPAVARAYPAGSRPIDGAELVAGYRTGRALGFTGSPVPWLFAQELARLERRILDDLNGAADTLG